MNSDTSLVAACKNIDTAKILGMIANTRISKNELNAVDSNGRTALSYICATSSIQLLQPLLRLPNIDVNKADNEGNTPLHFAAESGHFDVIAILCSGEYLKALNIDAKNAFGLTPLMKACVQGQLSCAKRLILANASLAEIDNRRGLTAENWARLCGHKYCANTIGKMILRGKLKRSSWIWPGRVVQSDPNTDSILSRIASFFGVDRVVLGSTTEIHPICYSGIEANHDFMANVTLIPTIVITPPTPSCDTNEQSAKIL